MLVSAKGNSVRFRADDATLRPMGRATSGVQGIRLRPGDHALSLEVVRPDACLGDRHRRGLRQAHAHVTNGARRGATPTASRR